MPRLLQSAVGLTPAEVVVSVFELARLFRHFQGSERIDHDG